MKLQFTWEIDVGLDDKKQCKFWLHLWNQTLMLGLQLD